MHNFHQKVVEKNNPSGLIVIDSLSPFLPICNGNELIPTSLQRDPTCFPRAGVQRDWSKRWERAELKHVTVTI